MKETNPPIGTILNHEGKRYIASTPEIAGQCKGCDFFHFNGEHNECNAPDSAKCDGIIFKQTEQPDYTDIPFSHDVDTSSVGCLLGSIALGSIFFIGVVGYALYSLIKLIIHYANI
jgi:hypothetical protein